MRFDLEEASGVTTVRLTHSGLVSETSPESHKGWPQILAWLRAYVEGCARRCSAQLEGGEVGGDLSDGVGRKAWAAISCGGCWDDTATAPGWEVYRRAANEIGSESAFGDV